MILLNKHNRAKTKKREDQPMKENKKLETSDTEVMAEIPVQDLIPVTESEEALLQEIQMETEKFFKNYMYVRKNMTYKGEEIPKDVPFTEYSSYIMRNFKVKKPREEWTYEDYKEHWSIHDRLLAAAKIKKYGEQKEPLTNRQKQFIEMVRNGTDFNNDSWYKPLVGLE